MAGIYGNILLENNNINIESNIEKYIKECFLEQVLNESSINIRSQINNLSKKDKITEKDIKDLYKQISEIENKKQQISLIIGLCIYIIGIFGVYVGALTSYSLPKDGLKITAGSLIAVFTGAASLKIDVDKFYYKLMKLLAQTKKARDKAEKLGEDKVVKECEKVISIIEKLKFEARDEAKNKNNENVNESSLLESVDYLLEYKGNEVKNNIFIQILDELDDLCKMNLDKITSTDKYIQDAYKLCKKSNKTNIKSNLTEVRKLGRELNSKLSNIKGYNGNLSFRLLQKEINKFNTKYSSITMNEKKKLAEKLESYKKKLNEFSKKYSENSEFEKEYIEFYDYLEAIDIPAKNEIIEVMNSWITKIRQEINLTVEDIDVIIKTLNIEKTEKSIVYKMMNLKK